MTGSQVAFWFMAFGVRFCNRFMPLLTLNWQNQTLFSSPIARCWRALALGGFTCALVLLSWQLAVPWAAWPLPSVQWQQHQEMTQLASKHMAAQQNMTSAFEANMAQLRAAALEHHQQMDDLILAWPNSAIRLSLLNLLHQMAQQRGLQVLQLKSTPEPEQHGYEGSSVKFNVLGTEWATHAYWQALNQLFQNGLWVSWVYRLLPDGQYALEGHLSLLWDAQDAFTDTGVALQDHAAASKKQAVPLPSVQHVLPDQSHGQMRLVGSAQAEHSEKPTTAWTWIRSGAQVHLVRPGQLLGKEQLMVRFADAEGLWLSPGEGLSDIQLGWDGVKP
jgi:hypothetical protein